ncbi:exonuclease V a 5' deoxyribonuclease-domain-containing protein [Panaeolus papilionaceus]|nr:exonuclease V a 5' deoxyribonuclease-domain-containing protein [Panaeolus papilionaceus]
MPESPRSEFAEFDFSEFTDEDFKIIDADIAAKLGPADTREIEDISYSGDRHSISSDAFSLRLSSLGPEELLELDTIIAGHFENIEGSLQSSQASAVDEDPAQVSFQSEIYGLNLNHLDIDQLAALDQVVAQKLSQHHSGPRVQIQVDEVGDLPPQLPFNQPFQIEAQPPPVEQESEPMKPAKTTWNFPYRDWFKLSPMQQYRRHGVFSVTDLVSPAWCELQFDYGLRGKRSRPTKDRPTSFKSATGKTIHVEKKISADNEVITKHGQAVHKELEKEVKPVEIKVDITTNETRWGLRLINMINSLEGLSRTLTREMPVFGIVHGEVVVGIIDEVVRIENTDVNQHSKRRITQLCEGTSRKRAKTLPKMTSNMLLEHAPLKKDKGKAKEVDPSILNIDVNDCSLPSAKSYFLQLKDNKTRGVMSLPSDEDAASGKLQLMLYRRLLQELLATSPPYDFTPLWQKAGVNPKARLPEKFLLQAQLNDVDTDPTSTCLDDLVAIWRKTVEDSRITAIDPSLQLVYRLRTSIVEQRPFYLIPRGDPDDEDLARAILASLSDLPLEARAREMSARTNGSSSVSLKNQSSNANADDAILQWALEQSLKDVPQEIANKASDNRPNTTTQPEDKAIIGSKVFIHNDNELDGFIGNVLRWWRGERKAQGVDLERSYRCNTCEYKADCEWREEKALEFQRLRV